jgi:putative membrane protein
MRRGIQTILGLGLAATVVACAGDTPNDSATATPGRDNAAVGTAGSANAERDFIQDQLGDGMKEVQLGRIAQERATNPQVKEFAQTMVRDHQAAGDELKQIATRGNVQLNNEDETEEIKDAREKFTKLSGNEFDREYIQTMIDEHQEVAKELDGKSQSDNAEVRQWVAKTLPKVQQHLEHARQLQQTIEKSGTR